MRSQLELYSFRDHIIPIDLVFIFLMGTTGGCSSGDNNKSNSVGLLDSVKLIRAVDSGLHEALMSAIATCRRYL